jgi:hypothetical protein
MKQFLKKLIPLLPLGAIVLFMFFAPISITPTGIHITSAHANLLGVAAGWFGG